MNEKSEITSLLLEWRNGSQSALEKLIPLVETELKKLAKSFLRKERKGHTLQPTALVNEAFIKLIDQKKVNWQSRSHFYAVAATCMRRILTDYARSRNRKKRGEGNSPLQLEDFQIMSEQRSEDLLLLDEALKKLEKQDERKSKVIELYYFGGFSAKEIAELLQISMRTAERELSFTKSWLKLEMGNNS